MLTDAVVVRRCWGCNRLSVPKMWASPGGLALLQSEGRLRFEEYLCSNGDCPAQAIIR